MIIMVSLDISTKSTGYAVFRNGEYLCSDTIKIQALDINQRQDIMIDKILQMLNIYKPKICVVEEATPLKNISLMRTLAMMGGAVHGWCVSHGAEFVVLKVTQWRKLICEVNEKIPLKREVAKAWALQKVKKIFDFTVSDDDEAEAILIGQAYINRFARG